MRLSSEASKRIGLAMAEAMAKAAKGQKEGAGIAAGIGAAAREILAAVGEEVTELRTRVDTLEAHGVKYCGVHQRAMSYERGSVCTCGGSAWIVVADKTTATPGDSAAWQLMVKGTR